MLTEKQTLIDIIERQMGKKILVVGDLMLDRFIYGSVDRISPEAPVPIVKVKEEINKLGGAGNTAQNLRTLGAEPILVAVTGIDKEAETIRNTLSDSGIAIDGLVSLSERPTTVKTRILAQRQQVVRLDSENDFTLDKKDTNQLKETLSRYIDDVDAVIISDYSKGLITQELIEYITSNVSSDIIVAVDPKPSNHRCYKNVGIITPNIKEASEISLKKIVTDEDLKEAGDILFDMLGCRSLLITLSERGMALFEKKGSEPKYLETRAREVYDVSGAGDTVIAAFTLAASAGAELIQAAELANFAAGMVVAKLGTASVSASELRKYISTH